jgi:hypothetical protein
VKRSALVAAASLALGFAWGFAAHHARVFPFGLLRGAASAVGIPSGKPPASPPGRRKREGEIPPGSRPPASVLTLPYANGQIDPHPERRNVLVDVPGRVAPGLNFYSTVSDGRAFLVDEAGRVRWRWQIDRALAGAAPGRHFGFPKLFPNGDVLAFSSDGPLVRLDRDSRLLWRSQVRVHHAAWARADGTIYALSYEVRRLPELDPKHDFRLDTIAVLGPDGRLRRTIPIYDSLVRSSFRFLLPRTGFDAPRSHDLLHVNNVEVFDGSLASYSELYRAGNVLISLRNISAVAILDGRTLALAWLWGPTNLTFQHAPTLLANGNILVFDNGKERRSSIVEVDPRSNRVAWRYAPANGFFSNIRGACQRLPNGNTLVTESQTGYAFEVTPDGETAWRFANPSVDRTGMRQAIYRMQRYAEADLPFLSGSAAGS